MPATMDRATFIWRWGIMAAFALLAAFSVYYGLRIQFSFDFEQFFPEGDEDLAFFREFVQEFETDDNFMLIAIRRQEGVFEQRFLEQVREFTLACRQLPHVQEAQSLTTVSYPLKTPFAITTIPVVHISEPERYAEDKARILSDERFVHNFITTDARTLTVLLKMTDKIDLGPSREFMKALGQLVARYDFEEVHYLGRPYFQKELVRMQLREIIVSAAASALLVTLLLWWLLRRFWGVFVSLISIGLGMLLFLGLLGALGRSLNALSALYPLLMIIVGTSDVVHILSKYQDELLRGKSRRDAIRITIKEIGLATFMTSATTAIGFMSLMTSRIGPIREFGVNSAMGVLVAFITVIIFTTTLLTWFSADQISRLGREQNFWNKLLNGVYLFTRMHTQPIVWGAVLLCVILCVGIARVGTNYDLANNLPRGSKITEDFQFFERELAGFRPLEFAVYAQNGLRADDPAVLRQMDTLEQFLRRFPAIQAINSVTTVYKSIHQMNNGNQRAAYRLPDDDETLEQYRRLSAKIPKQGISVLLSKDGSKARITSRVKDCGADSIKVMGIQIDRFVAAHTDPTVAKFRLTGTGLIIDKNAEYVRTSLFEGLAVSVGIISLLMALLFRNFKMLLISLIPNVLPLLVAGALLGYFGITLDAGISIIFTIVLGIAVDDSIHFLSRFKLLRGQGIAVEHAIQATMMETGKPIVQTTILLFFGFLVLLFSINPPSVYVGLVISTTLVSALVCDLLLLPVLLRRWM